jgi:hypothetical protein
MVMAPASTGSDRRSKITVINTDQTNKGVLSIDVLEDRMLITVEMKLMAPKIDDAPARCNLKIAMSTLAEP